MMKFRSRTAGTTVGKRYTREEGVRLLSDFQDEIIRDYRSRFSANLANRKYFTRSLGVTADGYGLSKSLEFQDLTEKLDKINETIMTWRSGIIGEDRAARALGRTLPGEEMVTLFGVSLRDGKERTEYDAVTITPYGVFSIEVKSYSRPMVWNKKGVIHPADGGGWSKNLGERINCKEYLLRNRLRKYRNVPFYNILLIADNRVEITDNYKRVPISYLNTVLADIRSKSDGTRYISSDEIKDMRDMLLRSTAPVLVPCPVDCAKAAEEYAWFTQKCAEIDDRSLIGRLRAMFGKKAQNKPETEIV